MTDQPYDWGLRPTDPDNYDHGFMAALNNLSMGPYHPVPHVPWWKRRLRKKVHQAWHRAINWDFETPQYRELMAEAYSVAEQPMPKPTARRIEPFGGRSNR